MMKQLLKATLLLMTVLLAGTGKTSAQTSEQIKNAFYRTTLGGNPFIFTDAVSYRGDVYTVQLYKKDGGGYGTVRLIKMNQIKKKENGKEYDTLEFSDYSDECTSGGIYQYAELVVWKDYLIVFWRNKTNGQIWQKRYRVDKDGSGLEAVDDPKMVNDRSLYGKFAVTVFNDELYLITGTRSNNRIRVEKTAAENPGESDFQFVNNVGKESNGTDAAGVDGFIESYYGPDDTWDAITWYGRVNNEATSCIVLVRMQNGWAEGYRFDGNQWIVRAEKNIGRKDAFSMKLVQGAIEGATQETDETLNNPVQCIYASSNSKDVGEIFMLEYHPERHIFTDRWITNIPYGWFGVTTGLVPEGHESETDFYRQIIYIISGNNPTYHGDYCKNYVSSLRSNAVTVHKNSTSLGAKDYNNPDMRKLITLIGVMEGPPPTVIDNQKWFDKQSGEISTLSINSTNTETHLLENDLHTDIAIAIGPHTDDLTAQISAGYAYENSVSQMETQELSETYTFNNNSFEKQGKGYLFYIAPQLVRFDAVYYKPSVKLKQLLEAKDSGYAAESALRVSGMPIISSVIQQSPTLFWKEISLTEAPFNVPDPHNLESWYQRNRFTNTQDAFSLYFSFDTGTPEKSLTTTASSSESSSHTMKIGNAVKVPFFEEENNTETTFRKESTSTVGKNVTVGIQTIDRRLVVTDKDSVASKYTCRVILIDSLNKQARNIYYPALTKAGYMVETERPWIIAWDINIQERISTNTLRDYATGNETIHPADNSYIYNEGDCLVVESLPESRVEIYNIGGYRMADQVSPSGLIRIPLPKGAYIVRITAEKNVTVHKAMKN